jgi:hypothetical protein
MLHGMSINREIPITTILSDNYSSQAVPADTEKISDMPTHAPAPASPAFVSRSGSPSHLQQPSLKMATRGFPAGLSIDYVCASFGESDHYAALPFTAASDV